MHKRIVYPGDIVAFNMSGEIATTVIIWERAFGEGPKNGAVTAVTTLSSKKMACVIATLSYDGVNQLLLLVDGMLGYCTETEIKRLRVL